MSGKGSYSKILIFSLVAAGVVYTATKDSLITSLVLVGYFAGGFLLWPDLSWGILSWIWVPYKSVIGKQRILSHAPIIGTLGRIIYFGVIAGFLSLAIDILWGCHIALGLWNFLNSLNFLYAIAGVEISAWVHLGGDWE